MKNERIQLRVSHEEKIQITMHAKENNMTVAQYMIHCALADELARQYETRQLILELQRMGVNLNQIARRINGGEQNESVIELLDKCIRKIETLCDSIMQERAAEKTLREALQKKVSIWMQREEEIQKDILQWKKEKLEMLKELKALKEENRRIDCGHF